jgi:hypothetical protein
MVLEAAHARGLGQEVLDDGGGRCWASPGPPQRRRQTVPCSELFWLNFLEVFPKALGAGLGVLPAILGFWGGLVGLLSWLDRRDAARRDTTSRLGPRMAYLEGRLLPFDEARRQREG